MAWLSLSWHVLFIEADVKGVIDTHSESVYLSVCTVCGQTIQYWTYLEQISYDFINMKQLLCVFLWPQNIPDDWSKDMLENFVEVATRADLDEDGVERFCGVFHTALLTFTEPLTGN